jgi:hypothetical protein
LWATRLRCPHIHRLAPAPRTRMVEGAAEPQQNRVKESGLPAGQRMSMSLTGAECEPSTRRTCVPACVDEVSCRVFLCVRCRSRVLVCRRCDRGQIYCVGTCAQEARRSRQREARRRYQATPRGRAMHAERNRRYRARRQCVTDHGLAKMPDGGLSPGSDINATSNPPSSSRRAPAHWTCHRCRRPASPFLRLSAIRRAGRRDQIRPIYGHGRQLGRLS